MDNGSTGSSDRVARIDASEVAMHFGAWWRAAHTEKEAIDAMGARGFALVAYMTGFRAALELITTTDMNTMMGELMAAVSLLDAMAVTKEVNDGDSDQ